MARRSPGRQDDLIYPSFAEQGLLHDMTGLVNDPAWADERAAIESFAWELAEQQGGTWGVPVLGAVYNIFINKTLLEEAGVLETWDDSYESMLEAAQALTTDDVYGWAARTSAADFAWWDWYPYVHNAGADVLSADGTSCGLVGSDVTDAMQFLIDIHTAGVSPPAGSLDNQGLYDLFKAGRIAILHHETPNIPDLLADPPDFEWDVAFAPPRPQGHTVMGNFGPATYVGLDNWNETFAGPLVRTSIINTLVYSAMAIPAVFIIAMVFALALRTVPRGEAPIRVALYVPTLQPAVVSALIFTFVLHPDFGIINFMVRAFGAGPINFLGDTSLALPTIAGIEVWRGIGFWTILFLAGLLAQPQDLHHAAELDGAGAARRFFRLTLPLLRPTFYFAVIFATIVNLQLFDSVYALTDGGPVNSTITVSLYVYRSLFSFGEIGFGATLSFILVLTVLGLTAVQTRLLRERR